MEVAPVGGISGWLLRVSRGWVTLAALAIFVSFSGLVLPDQAGKAEQAAGGYGSPDTSLYYSPEELYRMAEAYGERGREAYIRARFTFDLVWPLVYTVFLSTAIGWLYARAFAPESRWQVANLAPIAGAMLDYLENLATSLVMLRFPARTPIVDVLAPLLTFSKWVLVGGSFVLLLAGAMVAIWQWIRKRGVS